MARRLLHPGLFAIALALIDGLVMQQFLWSTGGALVGALIAGSRSGRDPWRTALVRIALPFAGAAAAAVIIGGNNRLAESRAERVIAAVEAYRTARGTYPAHLEDLVPAYLPSVPRAKLALAFADFDYWEYQGDHTLEWTRFPPFGRPIYRFEDHTWGFLD